MATHDEITVPTAALLQAWEHGCDASPGARGLILLAIAQPGLAVAALAQWPVGRRDAALLGLFERLFGTELAAQAECPHCGTALETNFPVSTIRADMPDPGAAAIANRFVLEHGGRRIVYRLPTAADLAALGDVGAADADTAARSDWLIRQCLVETDDDEVPSDVLQALSAAIATTSAEVDPLAEIDLQLECPACAQAWRSPFDVVSFLWSELDVWARGMLHEIHVLASHYGWSEAEIVALGAQRRRRYRELIGQ
ncbi:conserved hypothetical protein [Bradyrhizobium sp. ORS 278]|uniref:T4 family baseplate hub assembly chaperone n=1 Tax=Bradyrhizobium sp. (strain ORS 278) TaxID=114615 RepID=UPI000150825E|nr:hypothetical protein [Bradyrhizobium sp. ORS 278]CAL78132.1 conserved hypothetical protein [Bradyrhizobium sp. ORS 278]